MPSGNIARKLVEYAKVPIATPSANISGKPSGINIENIKEEFEGKVDYILDGGECTLKLASTIVKVINEKPVILRKGTITEKEILKIC